MGTAEMKAREPAPVNTRFTTQAQRVLRLAGNEAARLNSGHVGTEHVLLAMLHETASPAARSLDRFGVDRLLVWREIERRVPVVRTPGLESSPPRTPRLKWALERASEEARKEVEGALIGPRQLLIGLLRDPECAAASILLGLGVRIVELCDDLRCEPDACGVQDNPLPTTAPAEEDAGITHGFDRVVAGSTRLLPCDESSLVLAEPGRPLVHRRRMSWLWRILQFLGFEPSMRR